MEKMIADFFTKPLQGSLFRLFRDIILGFKHISELDNISEKLSSEECVRKDLPLGTVIRDKASEKYTLLKPTVNENNKTITWADVVRRKQWHKSCIYIYNSPCPSPFQLR